MVLEQVTLPLVIITALIDSINPCAIGVLLLLVATLVQVAHDKKKLLVIGSIYIFFVFITYILAGLGLIWFQGFLISLGLSIIIGLIVGVLTIILGLVEIKDFFWYGKGFSLAIAPQHAKEIKRRIQQISVPGAVSLGILVAMVELPCTGGPYLAITALLAREFNFLAFIYLVVYNMIFVLPLAVILLLVYLGYSPEKMKQWKEGARKWMRLSIGLLLVALGAFLIWYYLAAV